MLGVAEGPEDRGWVRGVRGVVAFEEGGDGDFEEGVAVGLAGEGSARVDYTFVCG
jgi:hypothetical protein